MPGPRCSGTRQQARGSTGTPWIATNADPVVTNGDFELLLPDHPTVWAFLRRGHGAELLVAANLSSTTISVELQLDQDWTTAPALTAQQPPGPAHAATDQPGS